MQNVKKYINIRNKKVNEFNDRVHHASFNKKFNVKAQDSVVGANSSELRRKIMNQIPNDPAKTKQLRSNLKLSEGERVETAINVRTEDGITNGAAGVVKFIPIIYSLLFVRNQRWHSNLAVYL